MTGPAGAASPASCGQPCPVACPGPNHCLSLEHNLDEWDLLKKCWFDQMVEDRITWINESTYLVTQSLQPSPRGDPRRLWAESAHHTARGWDDRTYQPTHWAKPTQGADLQLPQEQGSGASKARGGGSHDPPHLVSQPHLGHSSPALHRPSLPIKATSHSLDWTHNAGASPFPSFVHLE
jgi:hypothetical protein